MPCCGFQARSNGPSVTSRETVSGWRRIPHRLQNRLDARPLRVRQIQVMRNVLRKDANLRLARPTSTLLRRRFSESHNADPTDHNSN